MIQKMKYRVDSEYVAIAAENVEMGGGGGRGSRLTE